MSDLDAGLIADATAHYRQSFRTGPICLAVSGGSDSMALLSLIGAWAISQGRAVHVATVDHGLRPEAATEADFVALTCAELGVSHDTLTWTGWTGRGNLPDAARRGRYGVLADWARSRGVGQVALGHTLDDQAETVLMRLARGSGVDGLAGMAADREADGIVWLRPLLSVRRQALRDHLTRHGKSWMEDPSNDDIRFDRVKARQALASLNSLGITAEGLNDTAFRMGLARQALVTLASDLAARAVTLTAGDVLIERDLFKIAPYETQLRILAAALCWVSGNPYRPRLLELQDAYDCLAADGKRTLHGAILGHEKTTIRITREHNAVRDLICPTTDIWDLRWRLDGPHAADLHVAALGEAVKDCPEWRATGLPRPSLLASPAIWRGKTLIAAPLAGFNPAWTARIVADFNSFLHTH